ncbi:MAG: flagellar motor protein MotB [Kineosporiaceae bacterium]
MSGKGGHGGGGGKRRGGAHEEHEEHENHERWLLTYADMITLLMVLFIVMFAISQVDQAKFMALKTGLASGFGAPVAMMPGGDAMLQPGGNVAPDSVNLAGASGQKNGYKPLDPTRDIDSKKVAELADATAKAQAASQLKNLQQAEKQLKEALKKAGLPDSASFRFNERGLVVTIASDDVLFDSGSAALLPGGRKILDTLAPTLRKVPNRLSIDGHTNSIPISTAQFPSNWELSTARATGVLRYLMGRWDIPGRKMAATGFAETQPLMAGSSAKAMKVNRRVEILVLAALDNPTARALARDGNAADAAEAKAAAAQKAADAAAARARAAAADAARKAQEAKDAKAAAADSGVSTDAADAGTGSGTHESAHGSGH